MLLAAALAAAQVAPVPPDALAHAQAEALIAGLDEQLLATRSATATLGEWCAAHKLAADPTIVAVADHGPPVAPTPEQRAHLGIGADEAVSYRRVRLMCGGHVLSVAENWFVPARLDPAMVTALGSTDTPFGRVIASLKPSRQTLSAERLWHPVPAGWEQRSASPVARRCEAVPAELLRHRALVLDGKGRPLAEVVETYQRDMLAFPTPWARRAALRCATGRR
ncbi:MAG TPA: hypothetical protein VJ608_01480 [Albitalea sp.]|uniref:hypothetical protein n=1 Tax=Sphingomonas sp. GlSt437 TaxID=3389970 RepID=UPI002D17E77D|nr:hypothetical protein [Albitalea sp.]